MDCLCLFHDSDEYGLSRWTLKEISRATGASPAHLKELADKGVLKGSDTELKEPYVYTPRSGRKNGDPVTLVPTQNGPIWYSSRMVRDEYVRSIRGNYGAIDGQGDEAPKGGTDLASKPPIRDASKQHPPRARPSSSSSTSSSPSGLSESASALSKPKGSRKRTAIPDDCPNEFLKSEAVNYWKAQGGGQISLPVQVEKFRNHHLSRGSVMADWDAAWRTWFHNSLEFANKGQGGKQFKANGAPLPMHEEMAIKHRARLRALKERGDHIWQDQWGGKPGESDCVIPPEILKEFGFEVT